MFMYVPMDVKGFGILFHAYCLFITSVSREQATCRAQVLFWLFPEIVFNVFFALKVSGTFLFHTKFKLNWKYTLI